MFELGNNLCEARQRRRIDLVVAEQDTKIRSKYLAALETEDFEVLPGPVFVRGFLRTYASYLGLDSQLFIDEYNARFGRFEEAEEHATHALGRPGLAGEHVTRTRRTMRYVVVVTLVAVALFAWLGLRGDDASQRTGSDRVATPTSSTGAGTSADRDTSGANMSDAVDAAREPADPAR